MRKPLLFFSNFKKVIYSDGLALCYLLEANICFVCSAECLGQSIWYLYICTGTIQTFSAAESLERERQRRGISTSSASIDDLLGGSGIPVCKITEFCGEPGIGKTQLG